MNSFVLQLQKVNCDLTEKSIEEAEEKKKPPFRRLFRYNTQRRIAALQLTVLCRFESTKAITAVAVLLFCAFKPIQAKLDGFSETKKANAIALAFCTYPYPTDCK